MTPTLLTVDEIAELVRVEPNQVHDWVIQERIPYLVVEDGVLIWLEGFQVCMPSLFDLTGNGDLL